MQDYIETLSDFAEQLQYEQLPEKVVEQTKKYILDYYAASCAGYKVNKIFNKAVLEVIRGCGGNEQATVLFGNKKYPVQETAFVNAIYAHGADMDDGNKKAAGHIGAHVISAVFSVAEWKCANWKDVITAVNVGYEFFNRVASAAQPSLYQKGFHSTGIAGSIACAAACAKLLSLDKEKIYDAVSIAAVQSSGLIIIDESGQGCKPINPGNAARIGVFSALLAMYGIESPRNTLQSHKGWFHAYSDSQDPGMNLKNLGQDFTILESYLKLYPSCRHTHSCIDAALDMRSEIMNGQKLDIGYIQSIDIYIYPNAIKSAGKIRHPKSVDEAKFSIAYAVAVALCKGEFGLSDLYVKGTSSEISQLSDLITLHSDVSMEDRENGFRGCRMVICKVNGDCIEKLVNNPKGEGKYPLNWIDIEKKMISCSEGMLTEEEAMSIAKKCRYLDVDSKFELFLERKQSEEDQNE